MRVATVTIEEDGVRLAPLDPPELRERQTLAFPASDRELPPLVESPARGDGLKVLLGTDLTDTLVGKLLELSIVFGFGWETAPIFDDPRGFCKGRSSFDSSVSDWFIAAVVAGDDGDCAGDVWS
ncbi:hypothetical protein ACP6JC_006333 [Aspergillus fumigatus]